jgi:hypothetical protein
MIESDPMEIFCEDSNGEIHLADNLPKPLADALARARSDLRTEQLEYTVENIGKQHRPLEFGESIPRVVQLKDASLFIVETDEAFKILAVGLTPKGPLTDKQAKEFLISIGLSARPTSEEILATEEMMTALNSLSQSMKFVDINAKSLLDEIAEFEMILDSASDDSNQIRLTAESIEAKLHNFVSSVYTFSENADSCIKQLDQARTLKHHVQKYKDAVSPVIGIRHCIQHRKVVKVKWIAEYDHSSGIFNYTIGVRRSEVADPDLFTDNFVSDASGDKRDPVEYYFGDVEDRILDFEDLVRAAFKETQHTYDELKTEIRNSEIEGLETREKMENVLKMGTNLYKEEMLEIPQD